jgi:hypothetical protein
MKKSNSILGIVLVLGIMLSPSAVHAQLFPVLGEQRSGISTAQFLKIGVGARATGMGESFVAIANDPSALYWNPAGLTQYQNSQIYVAHSEWLVDVKHSFLGATYHLGASNVIGFSVIALYMDDMKVTTETMPLGTGEYFSYTDLAFGVTYARRMTDQFSFGLTVRYMNSSLDKLTMDGFMFDLGTYYWTGLGTSRFAVTVSNFGGQIAPSGEIRMMDGSTRDSWQEFALPTVFRVGFAMEPYMTDTHRITTTIQLNHPNDNAENVGVGLEYGWNNTIALRGGYKINVDEETFSTGIGVVVPLPFASINIDYSFARWGRIGDVHRFSLNLGI